MSSVSPMKTGRFRSVWISDTHLGNRECKAEYLLDFLRNTECEYLYLVGDIIDVWSLKRYGFYWPQSHNNVIRTILGKAKHNTRVIYIPGNHDEVFREYDGMQFGNLEIHNICIHETADGRRLLMMHGDEVDSAIRCSRLLGYLGDRGYDLLLYVNRWLNLLRRKFGAPYWSIATYLKHKVKNAVNAISDFEHAVTHAARKYDVDGLVCGHIHHAEMRQIDDILYCNDGDWVENCTAMVEHMDGSLEILHWSEQVSSMKQAPANTCEDVTDESARKVA